MGTSLPSFWITQDPPVGAEIRAQLLAHRQYPGRQTGPTAPPGWFSPLEFSFSPKVFREAPALAGTPWQDPSGNRKLRSHCKPRTFLSLADEKRPPDFE